MDNEPSSGLRIIVDESVEGKRMRGGTNVGLAVRTIDPKILVSNLNALLSSLDPVADQIHSGGSGLELDELTLNLDVSGEGQVSLLGTGVTAKVGASISVHLKPRRS